MTKQQFLFLPLIVSSLSILVGCSSSKRAEQALLLGWVGPTSAARANQTTVKPLYCYSTLGARECYDQKKSEWDHRLVSFYEPIDRSQDPNSPHTKDESGEGSGIVVGEREGEEDEFEEEEMTEQMSQSITDLSPLV